MIENQIIPHLCPEMLATIEYHQSLAHRVILISGSFSPVLDQLSLDLGVEGAIAEPPSGQQDLIAETIAIIITKTLPTQNMDTSEN